jgi:hypothetical protein
MSIAGYFSKRDFKELRMPKPGESTETRDTLSILYEGAVLTGQKSVEQAQREDAIHAAERPGVLQHIYAPR